jgi:copper chaperone NosL
MSNSEAAMARGSAKRPSFLLREIAFFDLNLGLGSRVLILAACVALVPAFLYPLWHMVFTSNQYTDGLVLRIHAQQLEGGKTPNRDDLREINSLNHYIGMRPLLESDFSEFTWLPLAFGMLILLALRAMILGKMSNLVDVFVLLSYLGLYSLWSFYHRLYNYGHNLDPTASIKVEPFTPPLLGTKQIANFSVQSYPGVGSYSLLLFAVLLAAAIFFSRKPVKE